MEEDIMLVEEVLKGNIDSFNIIVNKYELNILKFIYNMIKNKEAAEDITQEVFINVYNKLYMYNKKYKFSNWILQISRNKCIDYIRKYRRVYEADIDEYNNIASKDTSPEKVLEYKESKSMLEEFLNTLGSEEKQILNLRYSQQATFKDIAIILDMNESTVKRKYYKAKSEFMKLREKDEMRCKV